MAGRTKKPKKKEDENQSERFVKDARKLGVDETGATFEKAFKKIIPERHTRAKIKPTSK